MEEKELPEGWVWARLENVLPIQYGKGLVETERHQDGAIPVFGSSGIVGMHNVAITSTASLIIARKGSVGNVYYSEEPCWPIDTVYFAEALPSTNLKFFFYLLIFLKLDLLDRSTTVPGLSRSDYNEIQIKMPPFPEQQRIVEAIEQQFSRLDEAVALLRRAQKRLKIYRASVLKAAVEGKLTAEWRATQTDLEPASVLLQQILAERRAKWEKEQVAKGHDLRKVKYEEPAEPDTWGLPELPVGWCWATVEQICDRIVDCLHSTPKFTVTGFSCVDTNCIKPGQIMYEKVRYVDEETFIERNRRMEPQENDVLFSREGALLGIAVKVPINYQFCLGQRMMIFRLARPIDAQYYEYVLNSPTFRSQYIKKITGTASPHLNIQDTRELSIPFPSIYEQAQIVALVEERLSIITELEATIEKALKRAERQRQSILRKAFTGRLVPQNPEDEPASVLLERIRQEREQARQSERPAVRTPARSRRRQRQASGEVQRSWLIEQTIEPIEASSVAQQSLWVEESEADVSALTNDTEKQYTGDDSEQDAWQQAIIQASLQK